MKFEEEYSAEATDEGITFELELELKWNAAAADGNGGEPALGSDRPDHTNEASLAGAAGKFELFKDVGGKFRFRLKAGNGQTIAASEALRPRLRHRTESSRCETNAPTGTIDDQT